MKGFENRYTKKQVIIMLAVALTLVATVTYGWNLNVPNTFTGGTTISSSAVNSNFDFVESRLSAFNMISGSSGQVTSTSSTAPQNFGSYSFVAPQNGYVVMQGSANAVEEYRTNTACTQYLYLGVSTSATSVGTTNWFYNSTPNTGYVMYPFNAQTWFNVAAGSTYYVYINAYQYVGSCTANYYYISMPKLTIQFFPTYL